MKATPACLGCYRDWERVAIEKLLQRFITTMAWVDVKGDEAALCARRNPDIGPRRLSPPPFDLGRVEGRIVEAVWGDWVFAHAATLAVATGTVGASN
jgi:hypothetical protein